jgi:hypothetical protein
VNVIQMFSTDNMRSLHRAAQTLSHEISGKFTRAGLREGDFVCGDLIGEASIEAPSGKQQATWAGEHYIELREATVRSSRR